MYKIGVDIGGTNTDAVLIDPNHQIIKSHKTATTSEIVKGFETALREVWRSDDPIAGVFVGTTHAINALLEAKNLYRVGLIRLAGHQPQMIPPGFGWPERLKSAVLAGYRTVHGGYECD